MEQRDFPALAATALAQIEQTLEAWLDADAADFDFELKGDGVIEIDCSAGGKIIVNRHLAAGEIWLAARSGGFHFRPSGEEAVRWLDTRSGEELMQMLANCLGQQCGTTLKLSAAES